MEDIFLTPGEASPRIECLREHALGTNTCWWCAEWEYLYQKGFLLSYETEHATIVRHGMSKAYLLKNALPVIDEGELIVGKYAARALTGEENQDWQAIQKYSLPAKPHKRGQAAHMSVDYERLLSLGAEGVMAMIREKMALLDLTQPGQMDSHDFYRACLCALEGLCAYSDNYSAHAAELAERESDSVRRAELRKIAEICARVPRKPAETFYEALQSIHFLTFCMPGLYQTGRLDRILWPFYEKDRKSGLLTIEQAQELLDCFGVIFNEYVDNGLAVGYMVGGRDAGGNDITNELSYLCVRSAAHVHMVYPGIGLCVTADTPKSLLELSAAVLAQGCSHPALFNDEVITEGLMRHGLSRAEACEYIHSTCVEITPGKTSACWVASPYVNLCQLLLDTINIAAPAEFASYDALTDAFRTRLKSHMHAAVIEENRSMRERTLFDGDPLVSCFVHDCLENGRDIEQGGARFNWVMPSFIGMANLADALYAVKTLVFEEKAVGLAEICDALKNNFSGGETLRQRLLALPKYGNDHDGVDKVTCEVVGWLADVMNGYTSYRGGKFVPSMFCWIMHDVFGSETAATPDGRLAGAAFGDGSGPAQGREHNGPGASVLSSTKWDHGAFTGGVAINMKFGKKMMSDAFVSKLLALVETFMERGGFELQINVVDRQTLLNALEKPEQYSDLVVRIGGYSDYFVRLSPTKQREVIERTEHEI